MPVAKIPMYRETFDCIKWYLLDLLLVQMVLGYLTYFPAGHISRKFGVWNNYEEFLSIAPLGIFVLFYYFKLWAVWTENFALVIFFLFLHAAGCVYDFVCMTPKSHDDFMVASIASLIFDVATAWVMEFYFRGLEQIRSHGYLPYKEPIPECKVQ